MTRVELADADVTRVDLADVHRSLSLLAESITGQAVSIDAVDAGGLTPDPHNTAELKGPRRTLVREPLDERTRTAILPRQIDRFEKPEANTRAYRSLLLRQLGRIEFGTFDIDLDSRPNDVPAPTSLEDRRSDPLTDRNLLWQLYGLLDAIRVGAALRRRYPGAARDLDRLDADELSRLTPPSSANLREHVRHVLRRCGLGSAPTRTDEPTRALARLAGLMRQPEATASHAARFAWDLTATVLRNELLDTPREAPHPDEPAFVEIPEPEADESSDPSTRLTLPLDDIEFADHLQAVRALDAAGFALSAELLGDLAHLAGPTPGGGDRPIGSASGDDESSTIALTSDPLEPAETADTGADEPTPNPRPRRAATQTTPRAAKSERRTFLYDEWDDTSATYLRAWCHLREIPIVGTIDGARFAAGVRARHATLATQIRRRFATIAPSALTRVHGVVDGDELYTNALVDAVIERRLGRTADDRIYVRRERVQREVAAAFLIDLSRSTDQPVPDPNAPPTVPLDVDADDTDSYWDVPPIPTGPPPRRVIDVAKDAIVLMSEALDALGDLYAIYGFSGSGRANSEFFVAKHFAEPGASAVWSRVAAMEPVRYTRMGPPIRHATRLLTRTASRRRVLIVVSDGHPQDEDYGPIRGNRDYGIADTARALAEAERLGVTTFCITIDPTGNDYLGRMCPEQRYLVVDDVHQLPASLEKLYRTLTDRVC